MVDPCEPVMNTAFSISVESLLLEDLIISVISTEVTTVKIIDDTPALPDPSIPSTRPGMSAARCALDIPELLEMILLKCSVKDITRARQISPLFKNLIDHSACLRQAMFLMELTTPPIVLPANTPFRAHHLCKNVHPVFKLESAFMPSEDRGIFSSGRIYTFELKAMLAWTGGQWEEMLVTQSPHHIVLIPGMSQEKNEYMRRGVTLGELRRSPQMKEKRIFRRFMPNCIFIFTRQGLDLHPALQEMPGSGKASIGESGLLLPSGTNLYEESLLNLSECCCSSGKKVIERPSKTAIQYLRFCGLRPSHELTRTLTECIGISEPEFPLDLQSRPNLQNCSLLFLNTIFLHLVRTSWFAARLMIRNPFNMSLDISDAKCTRFELLTCDSWSPACFPNSHFLLIFRH